MSNSKIYEDIFTKEEIYQILDFYSDKPDAHTEIGIINKNLEYHIPDDFSFKLLNSKITKLVGGNHEFDGGAYKESSAPYPLHVDTASAHYEVGASLLSSGTKKYNLSILIPLVEGPQFKTVTFNIFSKDNHINLNEYKEERNSLDPKDFTHENFNTINYLPVDTVFEWKLGNVLIWPRDQWHASTNFLEYGLIKKFLIMFIA